MEELKKKWDDMKRGTKKRASAVKNDQMKTGGGRPDIPPLTSIEEDVVSILGEKRVFGFPSGLDTMGSKTPSSVSVSLQSSTPGYAATTSAECSRDEMSVPVLEAAMPQPVTKKPRKTTTPSVENERLSFLSSSSSSSTPSSSKSSGIP